MAATFRVPPVPVTGDSEEIERVNYTRRGRRLLYGLHDQDVRDRIRDSIGQVRADAWGPPDLSSNVLVSSAQALATLYDPVEDGESVPTVSCSVAPDAAVPMAAILDDAGLWPAMQRIQRDTIGLREMFVRVDTTLDPNVAGGLGVGVTFRPVFPDLIEAVPDPSDPGRPVEIREWRWRDPEWTREVWSIRGVPHHAILDVDGNDVSDRYGLPKGGLSGESYPALTQSDRAVLPYVLHHAALGTGAMFDPYFFRPVVEGSLQSCLFWSFYGHILRNAAWAQRYTIGAEIAGTVAQPNGTQQVVADPAVVQQLRAQVDFDGQPQAGQWGITVDPNAVAESIGVFDRRVYSMAGLDPSDVQRISGDPRSGYAIEISQKSKDRSALKYAPCFVPPDVEKVRLVAVLVNRALGVPVFPEAGWGIEHAPIRAIRRRALGTGSSELAGAQTQALADVVSRVVKNELPLAGAAAILQRSYGLSPEDAARMLDGAAVLAARAAAVAA